MIPFPHEEWEDDRFIALLEDVWEACKQYTLALGHEWVSSYGGVGLNTA